MPGQATERRTHEQLERHERADRVPGQAEQQRRRPSGSEPSSPGARASRTRTACRAGRPPATGRCAELLECDADDVVRPDRDPTRHDDRVRASDRPAHSRARTSSKRSAAIPRMRLAACRVDHRHQAGPFASGMPAGPSSLPGAPDLIARRHDADDRPAVDGSWSTPTPAARPIAAGVTAVPAVDDRRSPPRGRSRGRIEPPTDTAWWTAIAAGNGPVASRPRGPAAAPAASSGVVCSTGTTASAPGGIGRRSRSDRRPRSTASVRRLAGPHLADHLRSTGRILGRGRDVAARIA